MANKRVTELTALSSVASGDFFYVIDISDVTMSNEGTSKKVAYSDFVAPLNSLFYARNNPSGFATQTALNTVDTTLGNRITSLENGTGSYSSITYVNNVSGAINTRINAINSATGSFALTSALSSYVQTSQTGSFLTASALTSYVQASQTGGFATTAAVAAGYYPLASGNALNTATGQFVTRSETGAFGAGGGSAASGVNFQKAITLFAPQSGDTISLLYTRATTNFTRAASVITNISGAGAVNWNLKYASARNAAGANLLASDFNTNSSGAAQTQTSFQSNVPADNFIWLNVSSISGTVDQFHLTLDYI